jgi:hypothetical protein
MVATARVARPEYAGPLLPAAMNGREEIIHLVSRGTEWTQNARNDGWVCLHRAGTPSGCTSGNLNNTAFLIVGTVDEIRLLPVKELAF